MKRNKRFVFDTNVLVSAMLFSKGKPRKALNKAVRTGNVVVSDESLEELSETLLRERFNKYAPVEDRLQSLNLFKKFSKQFTVTVKVTLCRDPDDDKFLSLAKAARASSIVSGDKDLMVLKSFENIPIVTPSEFLKMF